MIGKISDLKMNKKQDHKGQLDDKKQGYSDQTERKQKDSNTRTNRDAFLQLLSNDAKQLKGKIVNLKKLTQKVMLT